MRRLGSVLKTVFGVVLYYGALGQCKDICNDYGAVHTYCDSGYHCCKHNTQCCPDGLSAGVIIGIILAVLFMLGICVCCAVLVTKKKKLRPNQVIRPYNEQNISISTVGQQNFSGFQPTLQRQNNQYNQQYYPYGQPTPYSQHPSTPVKPPPYSQTDTSAYPPPPPYRLES